MGGVDREGQRPGEVAGLLNQGVLAAPRRRSLEVCVERVAVQLHQVQDGSRQGFHNLLCLRKGPGGRALRGSEPHGVGKALPGTAVLSRQPHVRAEMGQAGAQHMLLIKGRMLSPKHRPYSYALLRISR